MANLEIGKSILAAGVLTNYHDVGEGQPVILIHGSGPGVSAYANWRLTIPALSKFYRVIAPDMVGFGFTDRPENYNYSKDSWVDHIIGIMDALEIEKAHIVGNAFGGGLAIATALRYSERVDRMVLMGAAGTRFDVTEGLNAVWGYTPSIENMRNLLDIFAYDRSLVTDELARLRYEASIQPGFQESFSSMFPEPRQRWIDALASSDEDIKTLPNETLIIHGREDQVVPLSSSLRLGELIDRAQLHVFGRCGHWTQIEQTDRFNRLVVEFFNEANTPKLVGRP
uniref:meta-Cleavage product hydrolase n=1 Tax=Pseudomonas fluorescens TaxID=294 RepID=UPI0000111E7E|nr:Chain A, meta-Cleavage product hydrolase [Pseudomonas fluorescens]1IUN_B Chain B, meta-Cleavage product hydrolase [Pseudomonas fluorescens]1IUO_A Chain A, meta-Cleavage product hydrolase [Pseudomonas fluorescens]1IUP_A Chain A, meta-Cleavage product hydrolase [Pseudomonas fluorescens]1UK6_A Chain A, 2-hydroxy-6-oxo-7-methylocta-2,4-dienoate hydrolase [Pseudomonas fluorescens]1UK7_A Chain A, 2-hydroxy-6-oxo-7-methylocta-2,4-dienoate hydrolase [Pseudomonas fluorescens]1UK8_A Chain A, 2-hydro